MPGPRAILRRRSGTCRERPPGQLLPAMQSAQTVLAPTEPFTRQPCGLVFTMTGAFSLRPEALPPPPVAMRPAGQLTLADWLPLADAVTTVTPATPLGPC